MKYYRNNLKVVISFIIGVVLASSITVYATSYFAKDITYKEGKTVEQALNDLYANKSETSDETKIITQKGEQTLDKYYKNLNVNISNVYETGEFNQYLEYGLKTALVTLTLKNTYNASDNARLVIYNVSGAEGTEGTGVIYFNTGINNKITSNSERFYMLNFGGESKYSQTYTCKYAIVKYDE